MRHFSQSALLSNIAVSEGITPQLATNLAATVFESHRDAERATVPSGAGQMWQLVFALASGLAQSRALNAEDARAFAQHAEGQLCRAATVLEERADRGCIRRRHGDLHLANIVLWQGQPML